MWNHDREAEKAARLALVKEPKERPDIKHSADVVLERAAGKLRSVVVMGWDLDVNIYFDVNHSDGGDVLWLLEKAKQKLLEQG